MLLLAAAALKAQEASPSSPYEGVSTPPPDSTIEVTSTPQAKPPAGQPAVPIQNQVQAQPQPLQSRSVQEPPDVQSPDVQSQDVQSQVLPDDQPVSGAAAYGGMPAAERNAPATPPPPALTDRTYAVDPDGDIVHPRPLRPGELAAGTTIRVRLLDYLSTASSEEGSAFRGQVASDVLEGGQVVIPAGSEIDGRVVEVSSGHAGGHGSMLLRPEAVILPDGRRCHLYAELTATPGSKTQVGGEGTVRPDSRLKRDSIEYGATVGTGAVTGAILGGPVGALAGTLVGASLVTVHLLVSHPQAKLEPGADLVFTLTEPLNLVSAAASQN
jgi:hypothetical protein